MWFHILQQKQGKKKQELLHGSSLWSCVQLHGMFFRLFLPQWFQRMTRVEKTSLDRTNEYSFSFWKKRSIKNSSGTMMKSVLLILIISLLLQRVLWILLSVHTIVVEVIVSTGKSPFTKVIRPEGSSSQKATWDWWYWRQFSASFTFH